MRGSAGRPRRRARVLALVVTGLLMAAVLWPLVPALIAATTGPTAGPTLPEEFGPYSSFTADAVDRPAGRAIAVYEYGNADGPSWQTLAVGADRDTYRTVDRDGLPIGETPVLLSPDGTQLLYFKASRGTDEFLLLDLATGRTSVRHSVEWVSYVGATISLLAWSPDGRYVAYAVPAPPPGDGRAESSIVDGEPIRYLAILDLVADTTTSYPALGPIRGAAFAPDGRRIAVRSTSGSSIVGLDGARLGTWTEPPGASSTSHLAWSPDGSLLAIVLVNNQVGFVDMTGTGRVVPAPIHAWNALGWRSATELVTQRWLNDEQDDALISVSTVDGSETVLSRFPTGSDCGYGLQRCQAYRIQLATRLLPDAGSRPSHPDRGPLVPVVHSGFILLGLAAAGAVVWWVVAARRPRRREPVDRPRRSEATVASEAAVPS